jgi:ABC-2 type transport system permease protein
VRNILLLALNSLKVTFRKKTNIIVYIILPIVIIVGITKLFGDIGSSKVTMGVVNKDSTIISQDMINYMQSTGKFEIKEVNEEEVNDKIAARKLDFAFIIPEYFGKGI